MPINSIKLEPGGTSQKYELLSYHVDYDKNYNFDNGKPSGQPKLTQLTLSIARESEENDKYFLDWHLTQNKQQDLKICFYAENQIKRTIEIKQAYLVSYNQDLHDPGTINETLVLTPEELNIDGQSWKRKHYL